MNTVQGGWRSLLIPRRAAYNSYRACTSAAAGHGIPPQRQIDTPGRHYWTRRCYSTSVIRRGSWESLDLNPDILSRLRESYPRIETPTPAQEALIRMLDDDGGRDVFLRDAMGRGKTFLLALACASFMTQGESVCVLVPTPQLVDLVRKHIDNLLPEPVSLYPHDPQGRLWLSTSKQALSAMHRIEASRFRIMMIDEPETLLSPLPPRHLQPAAARSHPFHKHPPPLVSFLDRYKSHGMPRTFWFGAELNGLLKRIVRQRGWAGRSALELDFCPDASQRSITDVESVLGYRLRVNATKQVEHVSLHVDSSGKYTTSRTDPSMPADLPSYRTGRPDIDQGMIDAIIQYHHQQPTPLGTTTLVLPPEGYPLDLLSARLHEASKVDGHDLKIHDITSSNTAAPEASMCVTTRSSIPGLDIPDLARVILINGLDLAGLSPAQRARGGVKRRRQFYDVVCGRLGRLGSVTHETGGQVVMCVSQGTGEEWG